MINVVIAKTESKSSNTITPLTSGTAQIRFYRAAMAVAHPSKGIDWQLYTLARDPLPFKVSSWANAWQNGIEQNEFQKTNGRKYPEEQQIIRLRGVKPLFSVILPYKKVPIHIATA